VSGLGTSFGSGAMTNSIEDLAKAKAFFVIGSNTTEQHPVIGAGVKRAVRRGARLIVADPRGIELARIATLYLAQRPGSDIALLNGLCHVIIREDLHDKKFVADRTEGFEEMKAVVETYTPVSMPFPNRLPFFIPWASPNMPAAMPR
jgi:anaerobic selenocysteine-containing dehydrogenase